MIETLKIASANVPLPANGRIIYFVDTNNELKVKDSAGAIHEFVGKSAYQVAVDAGYQGTVQEWLESLQGDAGQSAVMPWFIPSGQTFWIKENTQQGTLRMITVDGILRVDGILVDLY